MRKILLIISCILSLLVVDISHAQAPNCYRGRKVKERKERKRSKGALVGVKGKNPDKANKRKARAERKEAKARQEDVQIDASTEEFDDINSED